MTNSQDLDSSPSPTLGYTPLPRVLPANPWQRVLKWTWIGLLVIAVIVLFSGTYRPSEPGQFDGSAIFMWHDDGAIVAFLAFLGLAFVVAIAHIVVLAVTWTLAQHFAPTAALTSTQNPE